MTDEFNKENENKQTGVEFLENQNLAFQPQAKSSTYIPPKVSIFKKIFNLLKELVLFIVRSFINIFKKLFSIKTIIGESKLLAVILIPLIIFAFFLIIVNYFNIISLSYLYPPLFGNFPHRYDTLANKAALSNTPHLGNTQNYIISANFKKFDKNRIWVQYNEKSVEFLLTESTRCKRNIAQEFVPCSELLTKDLIGTKMTIIFYIDENGYNMVSLVLL